MLNQKMWQMDRFLAKFKEIKRFVTQVDGKSGSIEVEFTDEHKDGTFPQYLESQVIREALLIGGVDWSTTGVSERGFSNSLGLGRRSGGQAHHEVELDGSVAVGEGQRAGLFDLVPGDVLIDDVAHRVFHCI